ncbi:MAG: hypothetical protein EAX90_08735 [Candidatus Heimdallarchaeota archaeon]|nr:hypothetical protein [Candidatus Heimdallarchaeota archaeon]
MNYEFLIGKIAADKESKKLGKIIGIENLLGKTVKKKKPHAMIIVLKFLQKDLVVPIEMEKLLKYEVGYAWFNIKKSEFDDEVKRIRRIKTEREIYNKYLPGKTVATRFRTGRSSSNLGRKGGRK